MKRKTTNGTIFVRSWRDIGKLGYGSGGAADSPWTRQGIFIQSSTGLKDAVNTGGPGIQPERRPAIENKGQKTIHEFADWGSPVCGICVLLREGHDRLIARLSENS